ncbi:MAG: U32 family peptidase [Victivallaceae bacterium]|nr:U32 family peptidase [Victivallaceae bacterium]
MKSALPELLSPAGNAEVAMAAFDAGADAVYCGLGRFNARERAQNFSADSLGRVISFAHRSGRKVYVTFNTLVEEKELPAAAEAIAELSALSPDALIVQDLGVLFLLRRFFPELVVHASTQMGIHNSAGIALAARLGVRRVILERQVTLAELEQMIRADATGTELEVFLHGSLCCSLSGRCLLSHALYSESGNRGRCKQPCRKAWNGKFYLSPGDLDGLDVLPQLRRLQVASLKIEGRLRPPEYVWKVTRAYRMLLDGPPEPEAETYAEARKLLDSAAKRRAGRGFFFAEDYPKIIDPGEPGVFGIRSAEILRTGPRGTEIRLMSRLHLGDRLRIVPRGGGDGESFSLTSMSQKGRNVLKAAAPATVTLRGIRGGRPGDFLYKIGENGFDFSRRAAALLPARKNVTLLLRCTAHGFEGRIEGLEHFCWTRETAFAPAQRCALTAETVAGEFSSGVPEPWTAGRVEGKVEGCFFVPAAELKKLRREFWLAAAEALQQLPEGGGREKVEIALFWNQRKVFSGAVPQEKEFFPTASFVPEGELAAEEQRLSDAYSGGVRKFAVRNLGALESLRNYPDVTILTRFPVPVTNSFAAELLREWKVCAVEAEPELSLAAEEALREHSPVAVLKRDRHPVLLATRLPIACKKLSDGRSRTFSVRVEEGLSMLVEETVDTASPPGSSDSSVTP